MTGPGLRNGKILIVVLLLSGVAIARLTARPAADDASAKLYQTKCAVCHAADGGANTTVGKTLKMADLRTPEIQKATDAEFAEIIAKGKDKMPAYEKTIKPDQINGLVAYIRSLAEKK